MNEKTYTLSEARTVLQRQECAAHGHSWNFIVDHELTPVKITCACGVAYRVVADTDPRCGSVTYRMQRNEFVSMDAMADEAERRARTGAGLAGQLVASFKDAYRLDSGTFIDGVVDVTVSEVDW